VANDFDNDVPNAGEDYARRGNTEAENDVCVNDGTDRTTCDGASQTFGCMSGGRTSG
jgi:hypothetical protein